MLLEPVVMKALRTRSYSPQQRGRMFERLLKAGCTVEECTGNDELDRIKWTDTLRQPLRGRKEIAFDESRIREVLYRPFTKLWLYEDDRILSSVKTISAMFPRIPTESAHTHTHTLVSSPSNRTRFSILATATTPDLNLLGSLAPCQGLDTQNESTLLLTPGAPVAVNKL